MDVYICGILKSWQKVKMLCWTQTLILPLPVIGWLLKRHSCYGNELHKILTKRFTCFENFMQCPYLSTHIKVCWIFLSFPDAWIWLFTCDTELPFSWNRLSDETILLLKKELGWCDPVDGFHPQLCVTSLRMVFKLACSALRSWIRNIHPARWTGQLTAACSGSEGWGLFEN